MTYSAKVVADSVSHRVRLTSIEVTVPRYILAEINTHRVFSRNSASSRAIPVKTRVQQVRENPFVPEFTKNKSGMQADAVLADTVAEHAEALWRSCAKTAADIAEDLASIEVHKQQANRVLEPYVWHTVLITSTEWDNFFALRLHKDAAPEIQRAAREMKEAMDKSTPRTLDVGEWHIPYLSEEERELYSLPHQLKMSVARCAAVSYERQGVNKTPEEYARRHESLLRGGHWSPFEHQAKVGSIQEMKQYAYWRPVAMATTASAAAYSWVHNDMIPVMIGNFAVPWVQYRKTFENEAVFCG